jgi:serine/threonine-protein kinase
MVDTPGDDAKRPPDELVGDDSDPKAGDQADAEAASVAKAGDDSDPEAGDQASESKPSESGGPPDSSFAIKTPGDLLPAVSGEGGDSSKGHDVLPGEPVIKHRPEEVIDNRYVLKRAMDEGGMGVVWVARSLQLNVDVAVKLLNRRGGSSAEERMAREARAVAMLTHPAVVRIYDFGRTDHGDPYIAMELLHGRTLGRLLEEDGPLDPVEATQLLLPIVDALATAHDCGIVHRDLKPDNIFLANAYGRSFPKLLDFSLVKLLRPGSSVATLTRDGRGLGTAPYLSPEQVKGRTDVDLRTDVWALCAVLYRTTTGRRPFVGAGRYEVMRAVVKRKPAPTWELGVGDQAFWRILERGLQKKPEKRYPTMRDLGRDLASWLLAQGVTVDSGHVSLRAMWLSEPPEPKRYETPPPSPPGRSSTKLAVAAALGLAIGAAVATWMHGCSGKSKAAPAPAVSDTSLR